MSHIVKATLRDGQPFITSLPAAQRAAELLKCTWNVQNTYRGFLGRIQGQDAVAVIGIPGSDYDVGVVPDANHEGCYTLAFDPWKDEKNLTEFTMGRMDLGTPRFAMHYRMASDQLIAEQNGDTIEFEALDDGSYISRIHTHARVGE